MARAIGQLDLRSPGDKDSPVTWRQKKVDAAGGSKWWCLQAEEFAEESEANGLPLQTRKRILPVNKSEIVSGHIVMQSTKRISRIQSKSITKMVKTTVPPGQQAAMQASYLMGKSIRQIAREQRRDPATVSKIVKSQQMDTIVLDMKQKFFGKLLPRALQSVQFALEEETDGRLGYQVLKDSGVIPNEKETLAEHVSETEAGQNQENKPGVKRYLHALTDIACTAPYKSLT